MSFDLSIALIAASLVLGASASAQNARAPESVVLHDVRLSSEAEAPSVSLVLRNGRVADILEQGAELPVGLRVVEGGGSLALPSFVDAYTTRGLEPAAPVADQDRDSSVEANVHIEMREANRKGVRPNFRAVEAFLLEDKDLADYREHGFGAVHACPSGELLAGTSTLVTVREAALRDRVVAPDVFATASFRASGRGYPSTLMAYHAQLRQLFLDAAWHQENLERYAAGKSDRRPPFDRDLEAVLPLLRGEGRLLCSASSIGDIRRWMKLASDHGFQLAICGGEEAWRAAPELAAAGIPVLLDLDWGKEVEDPDAAEREQEAKPAAVEEPAVAEQEPEVDAPAEEAPVEPSEAKQAKEGNALEYQEPLAVRRERRRLWEERRDCALRLHEAGVAFAFGSADSSPKELLDAVRKLVEVGLPEKAALAALTTSPAELLGAERHLGRIEVGYDADLVLWTAPPFTKKARVKLAVVDGALHPFAVDEAVAGAPDKGVDLTGSWEVSYDGQQGAPANLLLVMTEAGEVSGTLTFTPPDGDPVESSLSGAVTGVTFKLSVELDLSGFSAVMKLDGTIDGDTIEGDATWKYSGGEDTDRFHGTREPQRNGEEN
jgi:hypothetical protein